MLRFEKRRWEGMDEGLAKRRDEGFGGGNWNKGFQSRIVKRDTMFQDFEDQNPDPVDLNNGLGQWLDPVDYMEKRGDLDYLTQRMGKRLGLIRFGKRLGITRLGKRLGITRLGKRMGIPWHHRSSNDKRQYDDYPFLTGKRDDVLYRLIKRTPYPAMKCLFYPDLCR